jgi:hypothetical protein
MPNAGSGPRPKISIGDSGRRINAPPLLRCAEGTRAVSLTRD